ncbi:MAG TPA: DMT family transporter [Streptosporangiaceae bacterium]
MLAVILALLSALGFGSSDFAAGLATRATSVIRVTILDQAAALLLIIVIVPFGGGGGLTAATAAWSAGAGAAGVTGAMVLYLGFRHAQFSVASTLSAVGSAVLSVAAGLLFGEHPGTLALTGIGLAIPAIAAVSASPASTEAAVAVEVVADEPAAGAVAAGAVAVGAVVTDEAAAAAVTGRAPLGRQASGVGYGVAAGVCFALYFIGLDRAGSGRGLWPVLVVQVTALAVAMMVGAVTGQLKLPAPGTRIQSAITGVAGILGTTFFFIASREGLLAVTAVITSLYPGSTILLARILLGERLSRMRLAGLVLAAGSVALIAIAGSS